MRPLRTVLSSPVALAALAVGLLPSAAQAGTGACCGAELTAATDVPLYAGLEGVDPFWYVQMDVGGKPLLLRVATGHRELRLTKAAAKLVGAKVSGKEGEEKAKIAEATLGGVQLVGLDVKVTTVKSAGSLPVDGEIGLPGLRDTAFAILPSAGVVRLAPADSGAQLVDAIGGAVPLATGEDEKIKVGKEKKEFKGAAVGARVSFSGAEVESTLKTERRTSWLAREVEGVDYHVKGEEKPKAVTLPAAPSRQEGESAWETREVKVGGLTATTAVERKGMGPAFLFGIPSEVGQDVLAGADIAVDPLNDKVAVKPAAEIKLADWGATAEKRLQDALQPAPAADGAAPDEKAVSDAKKGGLGPLADFYEARGDLTKALAARKELTTLDEKSCEAWLGLGGTLLHAGQPVDAAAPLARAAELYLPWSQLSLEERTAISEDFAKAEGKGEAWDGPVPQSHACHVAPGLLALTKVAQKDSTAVATLYPAQLDLDPGLPIAAGIAALQRRDADAAQAAFRQAVRLSYGEEAEEARAGLFLALVDSNPELARAQLERTRFRSEDGTDPQLVRLYTTAVRATSGGAAAVKALEDAVAADPGNVVLLTQLGREKRADGDGAGADKAFAAAGEHLDADLRLNPDDARLFALRAQLAAATGNVDEARAAAKIATERAPASGVSWLAMADVEAAAGNDAGAQEHLRKAGTVAIANPAYASLLSK